MSPAVAAALLDVFGVVLGVLAGLTGASLALMGACSALEGTVRRGLLGMLLGAMLLAAGLHLTGFLG